jgi:hypothetical protein
VPRQELQAHLKTCLFETLSTFFEINDTRLKALETRIGSLESRLQSTQVELASTHSELMDARHHLIYLRSRVRDTWISRGPPSNLPYSEDDPLISGLFGPPALSSDLPLREDPTTPQSRFRDLPEVGGTPRASAPIVIQPPSPQSVTEIPSPDTTGLDLSTESASPQGRSSRPLSEAAGQHGITARAAADISAQNQPTRFSTQGLLTEQDDRRQSYADEVFERLPIGLPTDQSISSLMRITARLALGMDRIERRSQT